MKSMYIVWLFLIVIVTFKVNGQVVSLDNSFGMGGIVKTSFTDGLCRATSMAIQDDGKIIAAGSTLTDSVNQLSRQALVRYKPNGALDSTFGINGKVITDNLGNIQEIWAVAIQADGKIVTVGLGGAGNYNVVIVRYNTNGTLDNTFGTSGIVFHYFVADAGDSPVCMAIQQNGKIVVGGYTAFNSIRCIGLLRCNVNGTIDTTFGNAGKVTTCITGADDQGLAMALQSDGKIVVSGANNTYGVNGDIDLVRYNSNGTLDSSFGTGGVVTTDLGTIRDEGHSVRIQPDGKIVVAGFAGTFSTGSFAIARYNSNGSLDNTFGTGGKVITPIPGLGGGKGCALQIDGKIIVVGYGGANALHFTMVRYNTNGTLDNAFGAGGIIITPIDNTSYPRPVLLQSDGKIVVTGFSQTTSMAFFTTARYNNSAIAGSSSPACVGGVVNLYALGGTSYNWSGPNGFNSSQQNPHISNVQLSDAGTYTVTVTGTANGSATASVIVQVNNDTVNATVGSNSPVCAGMPLNLVCSGGNTYNWNGPNGFNSSLQNPVLSNPLPGTYNVTVTGSTGCTAILSENVVVRAPLDTVITSNRPLTFCSGDSVTLTAQPGNIYVWNNGQTSQSIIVKQGGLYTVTLTDGNNCTATSSKRITVYQNPVVNIIANHDTICANDSALICAPVGFVSYVWNNGVSNSSCIYTALAGSYYLTVTDNNGCSVESNHVSAFVYPLPSVSVSVNGDTLTSYGQYACQWYLNGIPISGANTNIHIADQEGSYSVLVTDTNGCYAISNGIVISSIHEKKNYGDIHLYPNPANNLVMIEVTPNAIGGTLSVTDIAGHEVYTRAIRCPNLQIPVLDWGGAVYFVKVNDGKGNEVVTRLLLNR